MIPKGLLDSHFRQAAAEIGQRGVAPGRESKHYDLVLEERTYPPKYVISLANRYAHGKEFPAGLFNAVEAKDYFLRHGYKVLDRRTTSMKVVVDQEDESAFPEGRERYKQHRYLERDNAITRKAKKARLAETSKLECDVCGFDFVVMYGNRGQGFMEAHHKVPVSKLVLLILFGFDWPTEASLYWCRNSTLYR